MTQNQQTQVNSLEASGLKQKPLNKALASNGQSPRAGKDEVFLMENKGAKNKIISAHTSAFDATVLLHPRSSSHVEDIFILANDAVVEELYFHDGKVKNGSLVLFQTNMGVYGLDFLLDSDDPWTASRSEAFSVAQDNWVKMMYVKNKEGYDYKVFPNGIRKPEWPEDIAALIDKIIAGRVITSEDHPIVQEYIKAITGDSRGSMTSELDDILDDD